jgi:superfamily II DNA helicase RecQ
MANNTSEEIPPISGNNYSTPAGFEHVRTILRARQPFEPHSWQIEGICSVLDNRDLLVTTPTGSGKTALFIMLMLVIHAISHEPNLALGPRKFPKDPAMIVVCPTKALEGDMVRPFGRVHENEADIK